MQAARVLIARHGYAAVSMRQIAAETGIQAGALYSYVPDKQALLMGLMQGHMEALLEAVAGLDLNGAPQEALESFTRFHIAFHLDRPEDVFIAYMELRNLEPENFAQLDAMRHRYEEILSRILARGVEAGGFARVSDVAVSTRAVIAMLTGVTTWYRDAGALDREAVATLYWQMVAGAVGAGRVASGA